MIFTILINKRYIFTIHLVRISLYFLFNEKYDYNYRKLKVIKINKNIAKLWIKFNKKFNPYFSLNFINC